MSQNLAVSVCGSIHGLSSNRQSLHAQNSRHSDRETTAFYSLFYYLKSWILEEGSCFLFLLTMFLFGWGNKIITLVREHCKAAQMLPEAILRHYSPPTSSIHDALNRQNAGKIVAIFFGPFTMH